MTPTRFASIAIGLALLTVATIYAGPAAAATGPIVITHTPLSQVDAGVQMTLTARFQATCVPSCSGEDINYEVFVSLPWGGTDEIAQRLPAATDRTVSFSVPAREVAYPTLTYYFSATWIPCNLCSLNINCPTCATFQSATYAVTAVNRLVVTVLGPNGQPLANANWALELVDSSSSSPTHPVLMTGKTDNSGGIAVTIPANAQVISEATNNDGIVNFTFRTLGAVQGISYGAVDGLYGLFGPTADDAASGGLSLVEHTAIDAIHEIDNGTQDDNCKSERIGNPTRVTGDLAWTHHDYGMSISYGYGKTSSTDFDFEIDYKNNDDWEANGTIHVGNQNAGSTHYGVNHTLQFMQLWGSFSTETDVGSGVMEELWNEALARDANPGPGTICYHYPAIYQTKISHDQNGLNGDDPITNHSDQCAYCTNFDQWTRFTTSQYVYTTAAKAVKIGGKFCLSYKNYKVCAGAQSGYNSLSQIRFDFGPSGSCNQWYLYGGTDRDWQTMGSVKWDAATEAFADAGDPGTSSHPSQGVQIPDGCS